MLALFDTNIYIGELTGKIPLADTQLWRSHYLIRLSPVVHHELLRGSRNTALIEEIGRKTVPTPPPSSKMWEKGARVLKKFVHEFGFGEEIFRLQNDILIALTAREIGALVITGDRHFVEIQKMVPFYLCHYRVPEGRDTPRG